jgi:RNA polymerase sigma-70 factor (ECF subfamily)
MKHPASGKSQPPRHRPSSSHRPASNPAPEISSEQLMDRYVAGDVEAFNEIYARHASRLFGYVLKLTRNREQAEDLVQTTFAKVHRARGSYLSGAPLLPWMLAIVRRSFYDEQRAPRTRRELLSRDGALPDAPARGARSKIEVPHTLDRALALLPASYREAILLTKFFGYSGEEAAAALGTTRGAIKVRVHRGNRQLREAFGNAL